MTDIPPVRHAPLAAARADARSVVAGEQAAPSRKTVEAFRELEAFVLQSFIETMLPSNAEVVFGQGTAGAVWKSMLAEKLANEIALSGAVGIAQRLAGAPETASATDRPRPPVSRETQAGLSLLSLPQQRGEDA